MGLLAWVIMGIAIWHFSIWIPDRSWGGIVGAFIGSVVGAIVIGLAIHGFSIPGTSHTHLITAIEGIPGALIGMGVMYAEGVRRENANPPTRSRQPAGSSHR